MVQWDWPVAIPGTQGVKPLGELVPEELALVVDLVYDKTRLLGSRVKAVREAVRKLQNGLPSKCLKESTLPLEDLQRICVLRMQMLPDEDIRALTEEEAQALNDELGKDSPQTDIIPLMVDYLISEEGRTLREDLLDRILERAQEAKKE